MVKVRISKDKRLALNSKEFPVAPGKKYYAAVTVRGVKGEKYSAYMAIIMLDEKGIELDRKIRWLNDFSGATMHYSVTAEAPAGASKGVVGYRINTETAMESKWTGMLTGVEELSLTESSESSNEDFDDILDAHAARVLANARPLTAQEEATIEKNMVWVFSSARSGSSWLVMKLLNHKDIVAWNEPLIGSHLGSLAGKIVNAPYKDYLLKIDRTIDVYAGEADYFFSTACRPVWMPYFRKMVLQRLFCQYPESLRKTVVIKEPNGSLSADIIVQLFPNSRVLFLVRDGRDVADSVLDMFRRDSWANKWITLPALTDELRREAIIKQSNSWRYLMTIIKSTYDSHAPEKRLIIKYEELRHDTLATLKEIYCFLGIPAREEDLQDLIDACSYEKIPSDEKGKGKVVRKARPGGWEETFTEDEKKIMNSVMGEKLKELGYKVPAAAGSG